MASNQPTLLGLPAELRVCIIHHVLQATLKGPPLGHFHGSYRLIVHENPTRPPPSVPWLGLTLSCRALRREVQLHMSSSAYLGSAENTTYVVDVEPGNADHPDHTANVFWRKIPCPLQEATRLSVNSNGTTRVIPTLLSLFLHCGPCLDRTRKLPERLRLDQLIVNLMSEKARFCTDSKHPGSTENSLAIPELDLARRGLDMYHTAGYFRNCLGHVQIQMRGKLVEEFDVNCDYAQSIPLPGWELRK